jgi:hypothetical protein
VLFIVDEAVIPGTVPTLPSRYDVEDNIPPPLLAVVVFSRSGVLNPVVEASLDPGMGESFMSRVRCELLRLPAIPSPAAAPLLLPLPPINETVAFNRCQVVEEEEEVG